MKLLLLNGPNLNLIGKREPEIYGSTSLTEYFEQLKQKYANHELVYFQSNTEGELIDQLQAANGQYEGIIFNPAAYAHTSIALADAMAAIDTPVIEVHISNIYAREEFRHHSFTAKKAIGLIGGLGLKGYDLAISYFVTDSL